MTAAFTASLFFCSSQIFSRSQQYFIFRNSWPPMSLARNCRSGFYAACAGTMSRPCTFGPADQVSHAAEISAAFDWGEELEPFHGKFPGYQSHDLIQNRVFEVIGYDASTESFTLHILGVRYPRTRRHSRCRLMSWPKAAAIWPLREKAHPARKRPARYGGITCKPNGGEPRYGRASAVILSRLRGLVRRQQLHGGAVGIGFSWRRNDPTPFRARNKRWGRSPR